MYSTHRYHLSQDDNTKHLFEQFCNEKNKAIAYSGERIVSHHWKMKKIWPYVWPYMGWFAVEIRVEVSSDRSLKLSKRQNLYRNYSLVAILPWCDSVSCDYSIFSIFEVQKRQILQCQWLMLCFPLFFLRVCFNECCEIWGFRLGIVSRCHQSFRTSLNPRPGSWENDVRGQFFYFYDLELYGALLYQAKLDLWETLSIRATHHGPD